MPTIGALARASEAKVTLDLFTGTTRVAQEFCRSGAFTYAVDIATYSEVLAQCYIETDAELVDQAEVQDALDYLQSLPSRRGYVTQVFCESARYFHPMNGVRIDAIRDGIDEHYSESALRPILLTSLLEAADAVDSTVGLQMAFLKQWAPRALKELRLQVPALVPGTGRAVRGDATEVAAELPPVDFAYLDPPYNQHRYFTNYHVWETLVRWDAPAHYGVACKRVDSRDPETKSPFNSRQTATEQLRRTLLATRTEILALSFSDEGFISIEDLVSMCEARGDHVEVLEFSGQRHIGSRIGIHDKNGKVVGHPGKSKNTEFILISGERSRVRQTIEGASLEAPKALAVSSRL